MLYNTQNLVRDSSDAALHKRLYRLDNTIRFPKKADVVVLLEIGSKEIFDIFVDEYAKIHSYPYSLLTNFNNGSKQIGIISRFPITKAYYYDQISLSRPILYFSILALSRPLHFLAFHFKSQIPSFSQTEEQRIKSAKLLLEAAYEYEGQDLVVLGDANIDPRVKKQDNQSIGLNYDSYINLSDDINSYSWYYPLSKERGSYQYGGKWHQFDHFYILPALRDKRGFEYKKAYISNDKRLINPLGNIFSYNKDNQEGFSDHLPVYLELNLVI